MCIEVKFLAFHHPYFCQSLIPSKFYVKRQYLLFLSFNWALKWQFFTSSSSLTLYDANIAQKNVFKEM